MNISKNKSHAELVKLCKELRAEVRRLTINQNNKTSNLVDTRAKYKKRINKLTWKMFKMNQRLYAKDVHIENIKKRTNRMRGVWKRSGYRESLQRIKKTNYKVKGLSKFMFHMATVMDIYKLDIIEYSFIMWAGRFNFFDRKDFEYSNHGVDLSFYSIVAKMKRKGYLISMDTGESKRRRVFALTGTGVDLYNRIAKFTNKFLSEAGTSSIRGDVQDTRNSKED
jgi:hypothetical protein